MIPARYGIHAIKHSPVRPYYSRDSQARCIVPALETGFKHNGSRIVRALCLRMLEPICRRFICLAHASLHAIIHALKRQTSICQTACERSTAFISGHLLADNDTAFICFGEDTQPFLSAKTSAFLMWRIA